MRAFVLAAVLSGVCTMALATDRIVIVPTGDKLFVVEETEFVRLTGKGISGSMIEAKVDGPAKIESTSYLRDVRDGMPMIGSMTKEYDLKPTGKGKVTVTITVSSPIPNTKPLVRKVEFEVK